MSQKITGKNLAYDDKLPPFLARLRAQAAGASGPDPIASARRRPTKGRSKSEEAEDAPLVVDERGNAVALELDAEGQPLNGNDSVRAEGGETESKKAGADAAVATERETERVAGIGMAKKRKAGRVIGDDDVEVADQAAEEKGGGKSTAASKGKLKEGSGAATAKDKDKVKKKAKKIKLSFDGDGE